VERGDDDGRDSQQCKRAWIGGKGDREEQGDGERDPRRPLPEHVGSHARGDDQHGEGEKPDRRSGALQPEEQIGEDDEEQGPRELEQEGIAKGHGSSPVDCDWGLA
jgi:hypothetical protein